MGMVLATFVRSLACCHWVICKVVGLLNLLIRGGSGSVHEVNVLHELGGDSGSKVPNKGGVSSGSRNLGMILEFGSVGIDFLGRGTLLQVVCGEPVD